MRKALLIGCILLSNASDMFRSKMAERRSIPASHLVIIANDRQFEIAPRPSYRVDPSSMIPLGDHVWIDGLIHVVDASLSSKEGGHGSR